MTARGWKPDRWQIAGTAIAAVLGLGVLVSADVATRLEETGFVLLEVIGRVLDRPTSLVVAGYVVVVGAAAAIEPRRGGLRRELVPTWWLLSALALLGQGYLLALAWVLRPAWLIVGLVVVLGGGVAWRLRSPVPRDTGSAAPLPVAPVVTLFALLHVLVEGAAGHILTPWLHVVSDGMSRASRVPGLSQLVVLAAVAGPLALAAHAMRRGLRPIDWPHVDPRRLVDLAALPSLAALAVVGAHYTTTMWGCPGDVDGVTRLSPLSGAFDLEASSDGGQLLVSRREPQELLLLDLDGGAPSRVPTGRDRDTLFDRTEPETLLRLDDGRFLVLLASSDSEQGNGVALFDPSTGELGDRLPARGVSDVVSDGAGGVWLSTEFAGRIVRIDPATGAEVSRLDLGGAETNKIVVEAATRSAWSAGLWTDRLLRRVDLGSGQQTAMTWLGTHQWDVALSGRHRLLFVPRLTDGKVWAFDADSLESRGSLPAAFGVRPVEVSPDGELVVTGNLYTGQVVGRRVVDGSEVFRHRIGGHIKAVEVGPRGRVFAGSNCGVFEIDAVP